MAIKFPKLSKKEDEFDDLYSDMYDEVDDSDDDIKINEAEPEAEKAENGAFGGINEAAVSLKLMAPRDFSEAMKVADCLMAGSSVVLNIENIGGNDIIRFMDFLMGVIYVINGNMKHVSKTTVIVTPNNVGVEGEADIEA
jgi:FtsZ-interacting cell division protein YlmF